MDLQKSKVYDLCCPICKDDLQYSSRSLVCDGCSYVFQIHQEIPVLLPKSLEKWKIMEDNLWKQYSEEGTSPLLWKTLLSVQEVIKYVENYIFPNFNFSGKKVLEVGAGCCWASGVLKGNYPTSNYTTTDVSLTALLAGRKLSTLMGVQVDRFICADLERLPFKNSSFDIVVGFNVLHHVEPFKAVGEIYRVLKTKGKMIIYDGVVAKFFDLFYRTYFSNTEERSKKYEIMEQTYTQQRLKDIVNSVPFNRSRLVFNREYKYENISLVRFLLYKLLSAIRIRTRISSHLTLISEKG